MSAEQDKHLERQKVIELAVINVMIENTITAWQQGPDRDLSSAALNVLVKLAQEAGTDIEVILADSAAIAGVIPGLTKEGQKYISQDNAGFLHINLPADDKSEETKSRPANIVIDKNYLGLVSSRGSEALFRRYDVLRIKAK